MKKLFILLSLLPVAVMASPMGHEEKTCTDKKGEFKSVKKQGDKPFYLRGIELTDTQKAQVKALMEKRRDELRENKASKHRHKQVIQQLIMTEDYNVAEVEKQVDEQLKIHKQKVMAQTEFHHQIYKILNSDQRHQLTERVKKIKEKTK